MPLERAYPSLTELVVGALQDVADFVFGGLLWLAGLIAGIPAAIMDWIENAV